MKTIGLIFLTILSMQSLANSKANRDKMKQLRQKYGISDHRNLSACNKQMYWEYLKTDNLSMVKEMLHDGCYENEKDEFGSSALHVAVEADSYQVTEYLLRFGANVVGKDAQGRLPVQLAKEVELKDLVQSYMRKYKKLQIKRSISATKRKVAK